MSCGGLRRGVSPISAGEQAVVERKARGYCGGTCNRCLVVCRPFRWDALRPASPMAASSSFR